MKFKFKFKFGDFLLHLVTTVVIAASVILWVMVMTSDERFSKISDETAAQDSPAVKTRYRNMRGFYAPSQVYVYVKGERYQVHDPKRNLSLKFVQNVEDAELGTIEKVSTDAAAYRKLLNNQHYLNFAYPDQVNFAVLVGSTKKNASRNFNRVFVPVKSSYRYLYFANDQGNKIYRTKIKKGNFAQLVKYVTAAKEREKISFLHLTNLYVPFYAKPLKIKEYSYLINYSSRTYFAAKLLGSDYRKSVSKQGVTTYSSGYSLRLQVPPSGKQNDHQYVYRVYRKMGKMSFSRQLLESASYVKRLGLSEQDLRFFEADGQQVKYVNYIEGYPVFVNGNQVQASVTCEKDLVSVGFNSMNLQIPIPYDGRETTLPKTADLLKELDQIGIKESEIRKIVIGYKVVQDKKRGDLVTLVPTYYIKVAGEWNTLSGWREARVNDDAPHDNETPSSSYSYASSDDSSAESAADSSSASSSSSEAAKTESAPASSSSSSASASTSSEYEQKPDTGAAASSSRSSSASSSSSADGGK